MIDWCKWFGHKWRRSYTWGIRADMKKVDRQVKHCERKGCKERHIEDKIVGEVDICEGYYSWGSAGPCHGCINKDDCPQVPWRQKQYGGGFVWAKCPIKNFAVAPGFEKYFKGDTIVARS